MLTMVKRLQPLLQKNVDYIPHTDTDPILNPNVPAGLLGTVRKKNLPKEEGKEGGEKKRAQPARRARGSNPGPAAY